MAAPTLSPVRVPANLADNYYRLTVDYLKLYSAIQSAVGQLNMGETNNAERTLLGAISDVEGSH